MHLFIVEVLYLVTLNEAGSVRGQGGQLLSAQAGQGQFVVHSHRRNLEHEIFFIQKRGLF
mgnify:CR=1 FL=1